MFIQGELYSRNDIYQVLNVPIEKQKGNWNTGYREYEGEYYIFVNLSVAGRTGHDYDNHWEENVLCWYGKNGSKIKQASIKGLLDSNIKKHIFTRTNSKDVKFKYEGLGIVDRYKDTTPVTIYWRFEIFQDQSAFNEIVAESEAVYEEGKSQNVCLKGYERNKEARDKCIEYYGYNCRICNMSFEEVYGDIGKEFIHVHHINPLARFTGVHVVDPIKDLIPLCPNCHAMIHKLESGDIEELKKRIESVKHI